MVPSLTPTTSPSPKIGVPYAPTYANDHISTTGDPIHFMFGSRAGFFGDGGSNGAIYDSNKSKMAATTMLEKFISSGDISATGRPIKFIFCSRVGFSRTADLMALFRVRTNPRWRPQPSGKNFKWPYLRNGSRSTYIARIARSSLR